MTATRILVAEDESLIRLDLVEMLQELGYEVVAAVSDGQAAVDSAEQFRPDVCFLDVAMPIRDGLSAAEEIIAARHSAVVMVTAFSQQDMIARAASAGVMGYLVKPFTKADLGPAIEMAAARWQQMRDLEGEVGDLAERLAARDIVERAKARLQADHGISESEAFTLLRRQAMDRRVTLAEVASQVLDAS